MQSLCQDRDGVPPPAGPYLRRSLRLLFASIFAVMTAYADVCDPAAFHGSNGFSLSGSTTIGDSARSVAVVGRLAFDESGTVTGVSSASFAGIVLGNSVTGKYEAHGDCSVRWSLQDDSGAHQHFAGKMSADGARVSFRQTDEGAPANGLLLRTMESCSQSSLTGKYRLTLSGSSVDVGSGVESSAVSVSGFLLADGAGGLSLAGSDGPGASAGTYHIADDCFAELALQLPEDANKSAPMRFRAILADEGREVLGIQSDPGRSIALRLSR